MSESAKPASGIIPSLQDVDFWFGQTQGCTAFASGYLLLPLWGSLKSSWVSQGSEFPRNLGLEGGIPLGFGDCVGKGCATKGTREHKI